jgi:hypothetical protein
MQESSEQVNGPSGTVKFFTVARRFPQMIGRTPDGARIPGGPYSFTQVIVAAVLLIVGVKTKPLWTTGGGLQDIVFLLTGTWGAVWVLGKLPLGTRNPFMVAAGVFRGASAPQLGRYRGQPVGKTTVLKPHRVRSRVVVLRGGLEVLDRAPLPSTSAQHSIGPSARPSMRPVRLTQRPLDAAQLFPGGRAQATAFQAALARSLASQPTARGTTRPAPEPVLVGAPAARPARTNLNASQKESM